MEAGRVVALNAYARSATERMVHPIARGLVRLGATPNWLTTIGLVLTAVGAAVVLQGRPGAGAVVLAVGAATDAFDGAVARLRHSESMLGAFYDSVSDRVSDAILFATAAWLVRGSAWLFAVAMVALTAALVTSYMRAKAESLGWNATVGLVERPERVMILIPAIGLGVLGPALLLLAIGGLVTVAQRGRAVLRQAGG
jgi:CDP-diacylglycerol---glycerol-3-phosphate 3-phosphatidyltransferase